MDIVKKITIILCLLGVLLITPPLLRHFNVDVKAVYHRMLSGEPIPTTTPQRDGLAYAKKESASSVFQELFQDSQSQETPSIQHEAKQILERMVTDIKQADTPQPAPAGQIQEIPSMFRYDKNAQNKVRWLPPPPDFLTAETFNYLIYREQQPVGARIKTLLDDIHGNLMLDLTPFTLVAKPNKILVMLFNNKDSYMSFTKRPAWSGAASDLQADTMYILEGDSFYPLTVHELTHLYFDGYFLPSISPLWLSEGMAVYMQMYVTHTKPSWVDDGLRNILQGKYIPLEDLMKMEDLSSLSTRQAELWYTEAFSIVDYLLNSHSRDEFYRFCNELKAGTPVYQALYRAYGMPFNKVWLYDLAKKVGKQLFPQSTVVPQTVAPNVLSSTQTVSVPVNQQPKQVAQQPVRSTQSAQPARPKQTVIPKLKLVDTNAFRGGF